METETQSGVNLERAEGACSENVYQVSNGLPDGYTRSCYKETYL